MYEVLAEVFVGVAVAGLAMVQWFISRRDSQKAERVRHEVEELERERQRDANVAIWGGKVIDLMSELEVACFPSSPDHRTSAMFDELGWRASALVDRGRLFFPNVKPSSGEVEDEGIRVEILDHVLRACSVARHMAANGPCDPQAMRHQVWQARRNFVKLLQSEMINSLRPVTKESMGVSVPIDPRLWPPPTKPMRLPDREQFNSVCSSGTSQTGSKTN